MKAMKAVTEPNDSLYQSHCLYDATIAHNIYRFLKGHMNYKIIQVIGNFHIEEKMGVVAQLKRLASVSFLTISCFYDEGFGQPDWNKYLSLADFIVLTDSGVKRTF